MKNAILVLSIAAFAFSAGAVKADGDSGKLIATVDTVTLAQAEGEYSSISVIDEYGSSVMFDIMPATVISGFDDEPIALKDIRQNDAVEIEYSNLSGGLGVANSIKRTVQPSR